MFQAILNTHPYHIDSLLQLSEICKMGEDYQMAAELIGDWTVFAIGAILILSFGWIPMLSLIMNRLFLGLQPKKRKVAGLLHCHYFDQNEVISLLILSSSFVNGLPNDWLISHRKRVKTVLFTICVICSGDKKDSLFPTLIFIAVLLSNQRYYFKEQVITIFL